jgi:hypothetical protein
VDDMSNDNGSIAPERDSPLVDGTSSPKEVHRAAKNTLGSPKMIFILESGESTKTGYFGDLIVLDSHVAFH